MRASIEVADIFRAAGPAYRATHAGHLSLHQLKIMSAVEHCRTAAMGGHVEACEDCGHWRVAYNSCRNRHCPKCQGGAARTWLAEREADLLPVGYFHVVFTLPAEVGAIALQNKALVYDLLFRAASETMQVIAADPTHLGARIGMTAVLHSWGSALTHHPHIHMIVPGGGISLDGQRWISARPSFLLPVRVPDRHAHAAAATWSSSRCSNAGISLARRHPPQAHPGERRRDPARLITAGPRSNRAPRNGGGCADPAQQRTLACQHRTVRIRETSPAPEKQTVRSQIRPHIRSVRQRPERPKVQIPIGHRPGPAGSGSDDFRTPPGVRNSTRRTNPLRGRGSGGEVQIEQRALRPD